MWKRNRTQRRGLTHCRIRTCFQISQTSQLMLFIKPISVVNKWTRECDKRFKGADQKDLSGWEMFQSNLNRMVMEEFRTIEVGSSC
jgi:hypothetical protein